MIPEDEDNYFKFDEDRIDHLIDQAKFLHEETREIEILNEIEKQERKRKENEGNA